MGSYEWISWPIVVVALAILFRRAISSLLARLVQLKWNKLEVFFLPPGTEDAHLLFYPSPVFRGKRQPYEYQLQLMVALHDLGKHNDSFQRASQKA